MSSREGWGFYGLCLHKVRITLTADVLLMENLLVYTPPDHQHRWGGTDVFVFSGLFNVKNSSFVLTVSFRQLRPSSLLLTRKRTDPSRKLATYLINLESNPDIWQCSTTFWDLNSKKDAARPRSHHFKRRLPAKMRRRKWI